MSFHGSTAGKRFTIWFGFIISFFFFLNWIHTLSQSQNHGLWGAECRNLVFSPTSASAWLLPYGKDPGNPPPKQGLLQNQSKITQNPAHFKLTDFEACFWKAGKAAGSPGRLLQVCTSRVGGFNDGQLPDKDKVLLFQGFILLLCRA